MQYVSTRGAGPVSFLTAMREGLARDGGLYVPESIPTFDFSSSKYVTYQDLATDVAVAFIGNDMDPRVVRSIVDQAYSHEVFKRDVAELLWLHPECALLQLSGYPTYSFKDMALQLVARLMAWDLAQHGGHLTLLVATSGDTGSAVIEAFKDLPGIDVYVMFPEGRVSDFQRRQMTTVVAGNVRTIAIRGTFDDCQAIMKEANGDREFKQRHALSGVNSTNWARIMAQTAYWLWAANQAYVAGHARMTFAVPSGNFGNALSAYIARQMGAPADILVCTNANDVLDVAIQTGVYEPRKGSDVIGTTSPSMDISVASNFERMVYWLLGADPLPTRAAMDLLKTKGSFEILPRFFELEGIRSGSASESQVVETMRRTQKRHGYFLDPHTAVGVCVAQKTEGLTKPIIVAETALPIKFADACTKAYGAPPVHSDAQKAMLAAPEHFVVLDADVKVVQAHLDNNRQ